VFSNSGKYTILDITYERKTISALINRIGNKVYYICRVAFLYRGYLVGSRRI